MLILFTLMEFSKKQVVKDITQFHSTLCFCKIDSNFTVFSVKAGEFQGFEVRYAGHVDTGKESFTDPAIGGII